MAVNSIHILKLKVVRILTAPMNYLPSLPFTEFGILCRSYDHLRGPILERMPPIPTDRLSKRATANGDISSDQNNVEDLLLGDMSSDHTNVNHGDSVCYSIK